MPHTYVSSLLHVVFSTHRRQSLIANAWRERLHEMLGGIARERGFPALAVGGTDDHAHALLSMPSRLSLAEVMRTFKATSSGWVNDTFFPDRSFAWQEGYGAFGVGTTARDATIAYIRNQEEHHRERGFQDEFRDFLMRHGIECDERHAWGLSTDVAVRHYRFGVSPLICPPPLRGCPIDFPVSPGFHPGLASGRPYGPQEFQGMSSDVPYRGVRRSAFALGTWPCLVVGGNGVDSPASEIRGGAIKYTLVDLSPRVE